MTGDIPTRRLADLPAETPPLIARALKSVFGDEVPVPETLQIMGAGRTSVTLRFIAVAPGLRVTFTYDFPDREVGEYADRALWDSGVTVLGLLVGSVNQAFDGEIGSQKIGSRDLINDERITESLRRRLWAESVALLFPLMGTKIEIRDETDHSAILVSEEGDPVTVEFDPADGRPVSVTYERYDQEVDRNVPVTLELGNVRVIDSLPVMTPVHTIVEGVLQNGYNIKSVTMNPSLDDVKFLLR